MLVYLLAIINDGTQAEEVPHILNSWHTLLCSKAATAVDTLQHRIASSLQSIAAATNNSSATNCTDPHSNPLDQQLWTFDWSHCAENLSEQVINHVWLEGKLRQS